jgi:glyoxylase-like metal-dependent hydrolase (beta-lactamase superfamily II)
MNIAEKWFKFERIDDRLTLIYEPFVDRVIRCNIWHIKGRDRDLLVDTGMGLASLRAGAAGLFADRKLLVVLTHTHFDHVGGAYEFDSTMVHPAEAHDLENPMPAMSLRVADFPSELLAMLSGAGYSIPAEEFLSALPYEDYDSSRYAVRPAIATRLVKHGDLIDLGDRAFDVLHLPGHSPGSIGLWEAKTALLFSGDAIYDGPLLDEVPGSNIADYIKTMDSLRALPAKLIYGGHEAIFDRARMLEIIDAYLLKRRAR